MLREADRLDAYGEGESRGSLVGTVKGLATALRESERHRVEAARSFDGEVTKLKDALRAAERRAEEAEAARHPRNILEIGGRTQAEKHDHSRQAKDEESANGGCP